MNEIKLLELSRFVVCDTFCVGEKTVATGIIQRGYLEPEDQLVVVTPSGKYYVVTCSRIESFNNESNRVMPCYIASEGDAIGLHLVGVSKQQLEVGSLLCRFKLALD